MQCMWHTPTFRRCRRPAGWSGFCHDHWLVAPIGTIALIGGLFAWYADVSSLWQPDARDVMQQATENQASTDTKLADISRQLAEYGSINREQLNRDYPLGFLILYATRGEKTTSYRTDSTRVKIDWDSARIIAIHQDTFEARIPDVYVPDIGAKVVGTIIHSIPKAVGTKGALVSGPETDVELFLEVIASDRDSVTCVIGAKPVNATAPTTP